MTERNPFAKDLPEMAQGLREQAASETDALARPLAPDAPNGLTRGPERTNTYLNAISALSPLGKPEHWVKLSTRLAIANVCMAVADAENAALTAEADMAEIEWQKESDARDQDFADYEAHIAIMAIRRDEAIQDCDRARRDADLLRADLTEARATIARMRTGRP